MTYIEDRIKDLERWKNTHSNLIEHDHLDDFNDRVKSLERKVKDFEEWKHGIIHPFSPIEEYDKWRREHITLDKKVWDEIKQFVSKIGFLQPSDYSNLRDVEEKAEGGET